MDLKNRENQGIINFHVISSYSPFVPSNRRERGNKKVWLKKLKCVCYDEKKSVRVDVLDSSRLAVYPRLDRGFSELQAAGRNGTAAFLSAVMGSHSSARSRTQKACLSAPVFGAGRHAFFWWTNGRSCFNANRWIRHRYYFNLRFNIIQKSNSI